MNRSLAAVFAFLIVFAAAAAEAHNVQRVLSPEGIEAWLVQEDKVPLIAISFAFVGGASQDPADRPGVANMVSDLLDEGAGDLDSKAYQAALDDYAIELSFDVDHDAFYGSVRTLVENRDEMAKLLKLALTKPRFDDEPVERIRAQIEATIRGGERDPDQMAGDALRKAAFPGHPYGRPVEGTADSVAAIKAGDLRTFFAHNFARNNLKVAVVGAGMKTHPGVAADMFDVLAAEGINIEMISTSPIRISCVIRKSDGERAMQVVHERFGLEGDAG